MARIEIIAFVLVLEMLASLLLAIFKFTLYHNLSWIAVFSPFWMPAALLIFGFVLLLVAAVLFGNIRGRSEEDLREVTPAEPIEVQEDDVDTTI